MILKETWLKMLGFGQVRCGYMNVCAAFMIANVFEIAHAFLFKDKTDLPLLMMALHPEKPIIS